MKYTKLFHSKRNDSIDHLYYTDANYLLFRPMSNQLIEIKVTQEARNGKLASKETNILDVVVTTNVSDSIIYPLPERRWQTTEHSLSYD